MHGVMHILGHPLLPLRIDEFPEDSQLFNCWNFCKLAEHLGLDYRYYGPGGSRLPAGVHGQLVEIPDLGGGPWSYRNLFHKRLNAALSQALAEHCQPGPGARTHWVASLYGVAQCDVEVPDGAMLFEPMAGYGSCWTSARVFPSQSQRNVIYAMQPEAHCDAFRDAVIPHFADPEEYRFCADPGEYLLYLGRNAADKGVGIARQVAAQSGLPYREVFSGCHGDEKRALLANARAVLMPTLYPEPFGYVAIEAMLSGTPVIATGWGAFPEIIRQGRTGWCCNSLRGFAVAAGKAIRLDRAAIRDYALRRFTVAAVARAYRGFLRRLRTNC